MIYLSHHPALNPRNFYLLDKPFIFSFLHEMSWNRIKNSSHRRCTSVFKAKHLMPFIVHLDPDDAATILAWIHSYLSSRSHLFSGKIRTPTDSLSSLLLDRTVWSTRCVKAWGRNHLCCLHASKENLKVFRFNHRKHRPVSNDPLPFFKPTIRAARSNPPAIIW